MISINISSYQIYVVCIIFIRVCAIILSIPFLDSKNVPVLVKIGLSLAISIILIQIINSDNFIIRSSTTTFILGLTGEVLLGLIIGLSVKLVFSGIQLAGQLVGIQMGFGMAMVLDPMAGLQVSLIAQIKNIFAMLIFLTINAHHWFIRALVESFQIIPPLSFRISGSLLEQLLRLVGNMFIISLKVGAPVLAALLITTAALGIIARTVPQMHIFIVAMPIKIMVGLFIIILAMPTLMNYMEQLFAVLANDILYLLNAMR